MPASILAWPGAVAIGISLGLLGSGGSILTVPVLVYLIGQDEKVAIAGSLFVVGTIALAGSLQYLRAKLVDWHNVLVFGLPGMAGTYLGAAIAAYLTGIMQLTLFSGVMLLASYFMLRPVDLGPDVEHEPRATWKIAGDGLGVGVLTGLVGVGGGVPDRPGSGFAGWHGHAQGSRHEPGHHCTKIVQRLLQIHGRTRRPEPGARLADVVDSYRPRHCRKPRRWQTR